VSAINSRRCLSHHRHNPLTQRTLGYTNATVRAGDKRTLLITVSDVERRQVSKRRALPL
jgi:hypothetical protein